MTRRRRRSILPLAMLACPVAALAGWADLGESGGSDSLIVLLVPAVILGIMTPGILVSAGSLPMLLIPDGARIWWRRGSERRPAIPSRLRRAVYAADRYRCCYCGSPLQLQLDHVKPWSRGGLTALWNLMTLCGYHNRVKSNYWVARDGYVFYKPMPGAANAPMAAAILACEQRRRWSLLRWMRVGIALIG